ncbi:MAG: hypothetical protein MI922_05815 [Bacteroidales bacterium]|nr:hypothetical protein [Bacteroidales bacterium]
MIKKICVFGILSLLVIFGLKAQGKLPVDSKNVVFAHDFSKNSLGEYSNEEWSKDWKNPPWANRANGLGIIKAENGNQFLQVEFPANTFLLDGAGLQWFLNFDSSYTDLYFTYKVRFSDEMTWQELHGKLPGLAGGTKNIGGGDLPDGYTGWSARYMFAKTDIVMYLYHPDIYKCGNYSDARPVEGKRYYGEGVWLKPNHMMNPNTWYTLTQHVVMNTPTEHNGYIEAFINGVLVAKRENLRFRDTSSLAIDKMYFSTFMGGSGERPVRDCYLDFDDFEIYYNK